MTMIEQRIPEPLAFSPSQAAKALSCSRGFIYTLIDEGELPSRKVCGRRFISVKEVKKFLAVPS